MAQQGFQALLHGIAAIFTDIPDSPRRLVVSASKIAKGDATLSTRQRILGWDIDTSAMTLHLPHHREQRLQELLAEIQTKQYVSRHRWRKLLGNYAAWYWHCIAPNIFSPSSSIYHPLQLHVAYISQN
jgi:hypothetical protein